MVDGILDLLAAIIVMGIVLAIAFGFILPLSDTNLMLYDSSYNDKAMMSETIINDVEKFTNDSIKKYTYEEMVLLLSVQDNRMDAPKTLNIRNMSTSMNLWDVSNISYNNLDLNEKFGSDGVLSAIAMGGENHGGYVENEYRPSGRINVGNILFTSDYPQLVTENIANYMNESGIGGKVNDDEYYITYLYAIPDDMKIVKNNPTLQANFDDKDTYMVQSVKYNSEELYYNQFLKPIKESLSASTAGK